MKGKKRRWKPKSDWGDRFKATIPWWVPLPQDCSCERVRHLMNQCNAAEAKAGWQIFEDAITRNAKQAPIVGSLPERPLRGAIRRRMRLSFNAAFESD